jgi:hypothetical protein
MALDPAADITDVYAFVSYDADNLARAAADRRVTFIVNVIPGQDPSDGPNYFNFDDEVAYRLNIDNNRDGKAEDIVYEFRFTTETRPVGGPGGLTAPLPYLGNPHIPVSALQGITALDGPGSEGLTRRQTDTVTEIRGKKQIRLFSGLDVLGHHHDAGSRDRGPGAHERGDPHDSARLSRYDDSLDQRPYRDSTARRTRRLAFSS